MNNQEWKIDENDIKDYISACSRIVEDDEIFSNFKSLEEYNVILEHVDQLLGQQYFEHIQNVGKEIYEENLEQFLENDSIGNPKQFTYGNAKISPTTLRYIKNTFDLSSLCDGHEINKIVEVGCGYGGLCKTLSVLCDFEKYICVDLPEVVKMQKKYLSNFFKNSKKIEFIPCDKLKEIHGVDLFISNYALSELSLESQLNYYDKVIKNSKFVYITYNFITESDQNYNIFTTKMKYDGFVFDSKYTDYGSHQNIIIAAKNDNIL